MEDERFDGLSGLSITSRQALALLARACDCSKIVKRWLASFPNGPVRLTRGDATPRAEQPQMSLAMVRFRIDLQADESLLI